MDKLIVTCSFWKYTDRDNILSNAFQNVLQVLGIPCLYLLFDKLNDTKQACIPKWNAYHTITFTWHLIKCNVYVKIKIMINSNFQVIFSSTSSKCLERLKRYIMDVWNILDILVIVCYFIGLIVKMNSEFFPAKVMFSCSLLLSYFRLLQMLSITKTFGPKLTMISMLVISFIVFYLQIFIFISL